MATDKQLAIFKGLSLLGEGVLSKSRKQKTRICHHHQGNEKTTQLNRKKHWQIVSGKGLVSRILKNASNKIKRQITQLKK